MSHYWDMPEVFSLAFRSAITHGYYELPCANNETAKSMRQALYRYRRMVYLNQSDENARWLISNGLEKVKVRMRDNSILLTRSIKP